LGGKEKRSTSPPHFLRGIYVVTANRETTAGQKICHFHLRGTTNQTKIDGRVLGAWNQAIGLKGYAEWGGRISSY